MVLSWMSIVAAGIHMDNKWTAEKQNTCRQKLRLIACPFTALAPVCPILHIQSCLHTTLVYGTHHSPTSGPTKSIHQLPHRRPSFSFSYLSSDPTFSAPTTPFLLSTYRFPSQSAPPGTDQGGIDIPPSPNCQLVHPPPKIRAPAQAAGPCLCRRPSVVTEGYIRVPPPPPTVGVSTACRRRVDPCPTFTL